jgi:predicted ATPase
MRISSVKMHHFRRFSDLEIRELPESARLVVLAGPNGCGKSSLFDAFFVWYQVFTGMGWSGDRGYYAKLQDPTWDVANQVAIEAFGNPQLKQRGSFYFRSAYRNDPAFLLSSLSKRPSPLEDAKFRRMIDNDSVVSDNYERLASQAMEDAFEKGSATTTLAQFREQVIGNIRDAVARLFPDLTLNSLGNPIENATFRFRKGAAERFDYKNLSGGEKAAFDLILDIVVKRSSFADAIYCIDEPEAHMNTRLQGKLMAELYNLVPESSQLWIATHSIGMMRKARELAEAHPGCVVFLDFEGHNFDQSTVISPSRPTRAFWTKVLNVALDDLAHLVAPTEVVICEGNPKGSVPGKNAEHDAICYDRIFGEELPDVKFISAGNSSDVVADRLGFAKALPMITSGTKVSRLIDRDDHAPDDIDQFAKENITVLARRHIESYLYDDEVLAALCSSASKPNELQALLGEKAQAIADSVGRGNPLDDLKSAAGTIYVKAKQRLALVGAGNEQMSFARNTLASLITPETAVYKALRKDIFGI